MRGRGNISSIQSVCKSCQCFRFNAKLTSNLKRAEAPGNVLLNKKDTNLRRQSVVNVSQIFTVDKSQLSKREGALSAKRVREILDGLKLVLEPREPA